MPSAAATARGACLLPFLPKQQAFAGVFCRDMERHGGRSLQYLYASCQIPYNASESHLGPPLLFNCKTPDFRKETRNGC